MRIACIGFGQAGGKITDSLLQYHRTRDVPLVSDAYAVNTAEADLQGLSEVPEDNRVLIGEATVKGHGVGADNELGAEVAEKDIQELMSAIDGVPAHKTDAFLIVAGLGGGTGSGGAPVLAKHLQRVYDMPVYGLGVLPATDEGGIYTLNAARSFQTFVEEVDALLGFDNDTFRDSADTLEEGYSRLNNELVDRFGPLFSAGEFDDNDRDVGESVVDASEIINTFGHRGIVSVGYASSEVEPPNGGLLSKFSGGSDVDTAEATQRITSLTRKAARGQLTLPCDTDSVDRALLLVSGPPEYLSRKGIERGRKFIEDETGSMEVRGGDDPIPGAEKVAVTVVLAGVTDSNRIKELQAVAAEAQENIQQMEADSDDNLDALVQDDSDELENLF